ncbi:hypothetical protein [Agromyces bauzanensis]
MLRAEHEAIAEAWSADVIDAIAALPERERASLEAATDALTELHALIRGESGQADA